MFVCQLKEAASVFWSNNLPLQPPWNYHNALAEELNVPRVNNFGLSCRVHKNITYWAKPFDVSGQIFRRNLSKDKEMDLVSCNGIISRFTSSALQQPQVSHVVEVIADEASMLLPTVKRCYSGTTKSSSTTWRISETSCWVLHWEGTCLLVESFQQSAHKRLGESRGVVRLFKSDIFRVTALVKGDRKPESKADWHQNDGIVLKAYKI